MSTIIRDLYKLGCRVADKSGDGNVEALSRYHTLEITDPKLTIVPCEKLIMAPKHIDKRGNAPDKPNHGHDTFAFVVLGPTNYSNKGYCFWDMLQVELLEAGETEIAKAAKAAQERLHELKLQCVGKDSKGVGFYRPYFPSNDQDIRKDIDEKVTNSKRPSGSITGSDWIVLTYKGEPIVTRPAYAEYWVKVAFPKMIVDPVPGEGLDVDIITGESCRPNRLQPSMSGVPGAGASGGSMISFNQPSYAFEGQVQGANFPCSATTMRRYSQGWEHLAKEMQYTASFPKTLQLVMWPTEEGIEHPLLTAAFKVLGGFPKGGESAVVWAEIEALPESDDTQISVLLVEGATARITVRDYFYMKASDLRRNLLRFRKEFPSYTSLNMLLSVNRAPKTLLIPQMYMVSIIKSVLLGTPYREEILSSINSYALSREEDVAQRMSYALSAWYLAVSYRKAGIAAMELPTINIDTFDPETAEKPEDVKSMFIKAPDTKAAAFGRIVACFIALKRIYHNHGNRDCVHEGRVALNAFRDPWRFMSSPEFDKLTVAYRERILKYRGYPAEVLAELETLMCQIGSWSREPMNENIQTQMRFAWYQEGSFLKYTHDYRYAMKQFHKSEDEPEQK